MTKEEQEAQNATMLATGSAPSVHVNLFNVTVLGDSGMWRISGAERLGEGAPIWPRSGWMVTRDSAAQFHELLGRMLEATKPQ